MKKILDLLAKLAAGTITQADVDTELATVDIDALIAEAPEALKAVGSDLAAKTALRDALAAVNTERGRRAKADSDNAALDAELAEMLQAPTAPAAGTPGADQVPAADAAPAADQTPALVASLNHGAATSNAPKASTERAQRGRSATLQAAFGVDGANAATPGLSDLGRMLAAAHSNSANAAQSGKALTNADGSSGTLVASAHVFGGVVDESPLSENASAAENTMSVWQLGMADKYPTQAARTAAAGFNCPDGLYDRDLTIPECFSTRTPFADLFPTKQLVTMRYEFFRAESIANVAGGVTTWTDAQQQAVDPTTPSTWKPCYKVDCTQTKVTAEGWAIWSCICWGNFQQFSLLPIVANRTNQIAAQTARITEAGLMAKFRASAIQYDATGPLGSLVSLLEILDAAVDNIEFAERLDDQSGWTPVIPRGLMKNLRADVRNRAFDSRTTALDTYISDAFSDSGWAKPVEVLDDYQGRPTPTHDTPPAPGGPAVFLPTLGAPNGAGSTYTVLLVPKGQYHVGRRPVMNLRELHDIDHCRQNESCTVVENAISLENHGCIPGIAIDVTLCPSGGRAALEVRDCTAADYKGDIAA